MGLSTKQYGIAISKDVMVPMRDGVRLATDIYRPATDGDAAPGRFPTILGRTSYDKTNLWQWVEPVADYFTPRGYAVVLQDLRGRYRSEGRGQYFHSCNPTEGPDGYDTIEWIAARDWSNGRVGMVGSSHGAIVQQVAALHSPPHLTAIWPDVGPTNIYEHEAREGGAMSLQMFGALFLHAYDDQDVLAQPQGQETIIEAMENLRYWVYQTPWKRGGTPLALSPNLERILFDYYTRGTYDEFWQQECCDQERHWDRHVDIPGTYSGGWWDAFATATTRYYGRMAAQSHHPQRLVMGPWTHDGMRTGFTHFGDADFGADSVWGYQKYNHELLRWYDRWLKDEDTGVELDSPVRMFVMGGGDGHQTPAGHIFHGGTWREEREWPLHRTQPTPYYLHPNGVLSDAAPPAGNYTMSFEFDPDHPVPTIGASAAGFYEMIPVLAGVDRWYAKYIPWRARMRSLVTSGPVHQQERPGILGARPPYPVLAARRDVLVFQTVPLTYAMELTGPVVVNLWVSSSAPDTDFTAKLVDVYPPNPDYPAGYHMFIADSIIRTRFREGWGREVLMDPGRIYPVQITLAPTSNVFAAGHQVRIDISSSNFPRFDVNPNTGEPLGRHTRVAVAQNTVHVNAGHPSHGILPVIPV